MTDRNQKRRAVITGIGVTAPNGLDVETFWKSLCEGRSAASFVKSIDTTNLPTKVGCVLNGFNPTDQIDPKMAHRYDPSIQFGISASKLAVKDAGIDLTRLDPDRIGVVEGTSIGGMTSSLAGYDAFNKKGFRGITPFALINAYTGGGSSEIALALNISGHATTICTACSSGSDAIGYSIGLIEEDDVDVMIAGATEAPMIPAYWGIFCAAKSMSRETEVASRAMKPFDKNRDGFILGEGAAFVVIEELSYALERGADIYAEIVGYGRSCDSFHSVAQHPEGRGAYRSLEKALRRAGMHPSEVDYINVHGSATPSNDVIEAKVIKRVFMDHSRRLQISATKPVTGHLAGAAGAIESAICALSIRRSEIPPTINLVNPDPACDLDCVPDHSRKYPVNVAINMNAGFGGKNACIILKRFSLS